MVCVLISLLAHSIIDKEKSFIAFNTTYQLIKNTPINFLVTIDIHIRIKESIQGYLWLLEKKMLSVYLISLLSQSNIGKEKMFYFIEYNLLISPAN